MIQYYDEHEPNMNDLQFSNFVFGQDASLRIVKMTHL